jgi:hypothetical protein
VLSITTYGDTGAPPQPQSLRITQPPGFGAAARIQVDPTSCADLWGHLFYRHTANSFTLATTVGFGSTAFIDTNISYETSYSYWAAPVDFSFNVGSQIGPVTFVASRITTTDISTGNVSDFFHSITAGPVPLGDLQLISSLTILGSLSITTSYPGLGVMVTGMIQLTNNTGNTRTASLFFGRNKVHLGAPNINDTANLYTGGHTIRANDTILVSFSGVDSDAGVPGMIVAYIIAGATNNNSGDISGQNAQISAINFRR